MGGDTCSREGIFLVGEGETLRSRRRGSHAEPRGFCRAICGGCGAIERVGRWEWHGAQWEWHALSECAVGDPALALTPAAFEKTLR